MIFPWIWKKLPGKKLGKMILVLLIAFALLALLFLFVFPTVDALLVDQPTVE